MGQASTTLTVSTAQAIAELDAVILKAREAQALTQGLPSPGSMGPQSVRLPRIPRGEVPGGKAPEMESRSYTRTLEDQYGVTEVLGAKSTTVPRVSGPGAATSRAIAELPQPPLSLKPPTGAKLASDMAQAQGMDRLVKKLGAVEIQRGKLEVGPLELGATGAGVQGNFARKLLPAAVYGMIAYGALKTVHEGLELEHETIVEAAKTGRDPTMLFLEKTSHKASGVLAKGFGLFGDLAETVAQTSIGLARSQLEGLARFTPAGAAAAAAAALTGQAYDAQKAEAYARGVSELFHKEIAYITGTNSTPQLSNAVGERIGAGTAALARAMNNARDWAQANAKKAAEQLLGKGFPGTRRELREVALHEIEQGDEFKRLVKEGVKTNLATANGQ